MVKEMKIDRRALFTFNGLSEKEIKSIEILDLIRKKRSISRSEISKITGINMVSISNYIREYIEKGIVLEKGLDVSSGGRKPELIELNAESRFAIGMAITDSSARACLINAAMEVKKKKEATINGKDINDLITVTAKLIKDILEGAGLSGHNLPAVAISVSDEKFFPIGEAVGKELGVNAFVGTDAFAAIFAEFETRPDVQDEALLYIHSDVGSGAVIKKGIFISGADDEGAEYPPAEKRYLKPWGSGLAISHIAKHEVSRGIGTKIVDIAQGKIDNVTMDVVIEAAKQHDQIALDIIHSTGINLGLRLAYLVNLFSPQVVIVGGGIEKAGELFLEPIRKMVKKLAFSELKDIKIVPGALDEYAVSFGASLLGMREIFLKV